jgi:hypothetical protein
MDGQKLSSGGQSGKILAIESNITPVELVWGGPVSMCH